MITLSSSGSFRRTEQFLSRMATADIFSQLSVYGQVGVNALAAATPKDSGETSAMWFYEIVKEGGTYSIVWSNSHMAGDTPVAVLLQYGHGTGTGGYVQGRDYINPAIQPIFDKIAAEAWKVVTSA